MSIMITATEAVRRFSELLNAVKYRNDSYTIVRGGKPAAVIIPAVSTGTGKSLKELPETLAKLPGLANDNKSFARDVQDALRRQPSVPDNSLWE